MKVAVVAANGRTGRLVVQELLAAGHTVVAGVSSSGALSPRERLSVQTCDARELEAVMSLVEGCAAIVSCLGHVRGSDTDVQTAATMNIIRAARHQQIARVVSVTGTGVRFPGDTPSLVDRLANIAVTLVDPARVSDGIAHADVLRASGLEWTIIRVLKLTNGPAGPFSLSAHGPAKWFTPRAEVAQAIRQVLENHSHVAAAPIISAAQA